MKRSRKITLALMGTTAIALSACDEREPINAGVYESLHQCVQYHGAERCAAGYNEAKSQHAMVAPRFASKEDCEAEFGAGQCESGKGAGAVGTQAASSSSGSGSFFIPFMMGYMLGGNSGSGASYASAPSQPLYRSAGSKTFTTGDARVVSDRVGPVSVKPASSLSRPASTKTTTISRGGFASAARSGGGFGG